MRKYLFVLVAIALMVTPAFALVETDNNGPQNMTSAYISGVGSCTSGNVVVLRWTTPTYPGGEVTFSTTYGENIYGVVVDTVNYDANDLDNGKWIKIQTYGKAGALVNANLGIAVGDSLCTSTTRGQATLAGTASTGNVVALDSATVTTSAGKVLDCFINW